MNVLKTAFSSWLISFFRSSPNKKQKSMFSISRQHICNLEQRYRILFWNYHLDSGCPYIYVYIQKPHCVISSFRHTKQTKHRNSMELSKHVWSLKDNNIDYSISWRIISSSSSYNGSSKRCNLCLKGKFLIICRPDLSSLNKRNELVSSCRHRNKALLCNN